MSKSWYLDAGLAVYCSPTNTSEAQILMVHGSVDRAAGMIRIARNLSDYRVLRYDRRGYGRSQTDSKSVSFEEHVDDLENLIRDVPTVVFGHSYGGSVALGAAERENKSILAVVCYEAPRGWEEWWPPPPPVDVEPGDAAEHFVRRMIGESRWEALPPRSRQRLRSQGPLMVHELDTQTTQRYVIADIKAPIYVGVGALSGPHAQRAAELTVQEAVRGSLVRIPGAKHDAPMSHASQIAAIIRKAIDGVF